MSELVNRLGILKKGANAPKALDPSAAEKERQEKINELLKIQHHLLHIAVLGHKLHYLAAHGEVPHSPNPSGFYYISPNLFTDDIPVDVLDVYDLSRGGIFSRMTGSSYGRQWYPSQISSVGLSTLQRYSLDADALAEGRMVPVELKAS